MLFNAIGELFEAIECPRGFLERHLSQVIIRIRWNILLTSEYNRDVDEYQVRQSNKCDIDSATNRHKNGQIVHSQ